MTTFFLSLSCMELYVRKQAQGWLELAWPCPQQEMRRCLPCVASDVGCLADRAVMLTTVTEYNHGRNWTETCEGSLPSRLQAVCACVHERISCAGSCGLQGLRFLYSEARRGIRFPHQDYVLGIWYIKADVSGGEHHKHRGWRRLTLRSPVAGVAAAASKPAEVTQTFACQAVCDTRRK
jgi:hypothetical protein